MTWALRSLNELGTVSRGRSRHRPRDAAHLYGGEHPFIQTGDVKASGLYIRNWTQTLSDAGLAQSKKWPVGTLCITIAANIADTCILDFEACFPDSVIGFVADPAEADTRFVKYLFDFSLKRKFQTFSQGAAQDNLSQEKLLSIRFQVPDKDIQVGIADVLSAYDRAIENNERRIGLLEQAARLIYREWFVRLRFPGHEHLETEAGVPKGWSKAPLGTLVAIRKGKNITKETVVEGEVPVVAGGLQPAYFHNTANVPGPAITVSASGANAGFVNLYHTDIWASDCSYISSDATPNIYFFFLLLRDRHSEIHAMQKGAAQPHVYPKDLERLVVLYPSDALLQEFADLVAPVFRQIRVLQDQSQKLGGARNLLLPRLMSGEVQI